MHTRVGDHHELPLAAVVLRTARSALGISCEDVAAAGGCDVSLVEGIESGAHDPVMDTVNRLLNGVGLEIRCGPATGPNPAYQQVDPGEVKRVADAIGAAREFWARFNRPSPHPIAGTQTEWDGQPPAPPHLFGAGPGRRHAGGWAAILVWSLRWDTKMTEAVFAAAIGVSTAELARIETGEQLPTMSDVERFMEAVGRALSVRVEVYDAHDDGLHLDALANPDQVAETIRRTRQTAAAAIVL